MKIIDGKKIAERIKDQIVIDTEKIVKDALRRPSLAIILVGEREDSKLYVSLKEKEAVKLGIDTSLYKFSSDVSEEEILETINFLNKDSDIDAILVQMPLPPSLDADKIIASLDPKKDADGFHVDHPDYIVSPVMGAVLEILRDISFVSAGRQACVLHNSPVFGLEAKRVLEKEALKVDLVPIGDLDKLNEAEKQAKLEQIKTSARSADVLISALGRPRFLKVDILKSGAVLIDIGITRVGEKVYGDFDFEDVQTRSGFITPVPGGVGPITIALLFRNVLEIYKHRF